MKTVFLGTPGLAVPFLESLARQSQVLSVITAPDHPAGRGYALKPPEVKVAALRLSLPVRQPERLRDDSFLNAFRELAPDLGVVVAYGKLLPLSLLAIPKYGFLNVHFSLLPAYRGAAPIQWALINGEHETGVTLFWLDEGMDTGPIFLQKKLAIGQDDAESLRQKLVVIGVDAMNEALNLLNQGKVIRESQGAAGPKAPMLQKEDGKIDWKRPAESIVNLIRGTTPWPGAFAIVKGGAHPGRLKILNAAVVTGDGTEPEGSMVRLEGGEGFVVRCSQNFLKVTQVQPEGKKAMSAWDFWQGAHLNLGDKLE